MTPSYTVTYLPQAEKFFKKSPSNISSHIFKSILSVAHHPFAPNNNLKKLKDPLDGYRLRVGNYRAIYLLDTTTYRLIVTKIDHRSKIYE